VRRTGAGNGCAFAAARVAAEFAGPAHVVAALVARIRLAQDGPAWHVGGEAQATAAAAADGAGGTADARTRILLPLAHADTAAVGPAMSGIAAVARVVAADEALRTGDTGDAAAEAPSHRCGTVTGAGVARVVRRTPAAARGGGGEDRQQRGGERTRVPASAAPGDRARHAVQEVLVESRHRATLPS